MTFQMAPFMQCFPIYTLQLHQRQVMDIREKKKQTSAPTYYILTVIIILLDTMNVIYAVILAPCDTLNTVGIGQYIYSNT